MFIKNSATMWALLYTSRWQIWFSCKLLQGRTSHAEKRDSRMINFDSLSHNGLGNENFETCIAPTPSTREEIRSTYVLLSHRHYCLKPECESIICKQGRAAVGSLYISKVPKVQTFATPTETSKNA